MILFFLVITVAKLVKYIKQEKKQRVIKMEEIQYLKPLFNAETDGNVVFPLNDEDAVDSLEVAIRNDNDIRNQFVSHFG